MVKFGRIKPIIALFAVIIFIAAIFLCAPIDTVYATDFGGVDSSGFWFLGSNGVKLAEAKNVVDGWNKSALSPVLIAVIDTGVDASHDLFKDVLYRNSEGKVEGFNSLKNKVVFDAELKDTNSEKHGNSVTGVIAMLIKELGLENYIKIYPIKANSDTTDGGTFSIPSVVSGINKAREMGAFATNLSLGIKKSDITASADWANDKDLLYAISSSSEDMVIVAAAGNNGADSANANGAFYPAALNGVFSVMSGGKNGELFKTSNYGTHYDIVAPGEEIYTANSAIGSTYHELDGTSMATPFATVAAALLKLRFEAEGKGALNGVNAARLLRNLNTRKILKGNYAFSTLEYATLLTQDFDTTEFEYDTPTGIAISHNGTLGSGDYKESIHMRADDVKPVNFIAKIEPFGYTDPDLNSTVSWYLVKGEDEMLLSSGTKFDYTASEFGKTQIVARFTYGGKQFEAKQDVYIEYLPYLVGDVRVTFAENAGDDVLSAPSKGVLYTKEARKFSLTGIEYADRDVTIKWFVDGVEAGEGRIFEYTPTEVGRHIITAKFGDKPIIGTDYVFVAEVKPFILRPLDLSMLIIGLALVLGVGITVTVIFVKRKKKTESAAPIENKEEN